MMFFTFLLVFVNVSLVFANELRSTSTAVKSQVHLETGHNHLMGKAKLMNVVGAFPTNPTYYTAYAYADTNCNTVALAFSGLLNTCLASATTSVKYTCGKYRHPHTRFLSFYV